MWNSTTVGLLRQLADEGTTLKRAATRLGVPPEQARQKAERLHLVFREPGPQGYGVWLHRRVDRLDRRVKNLSDQVMATRDKRVAPLLTEKAQSCWLLFVSLGRFLRRWERRLGANLDILLARLEKIKITLQNIREKVRKRRAIEWKRLGQLLFNWITFLASILQGLGALAQLAG